MTSAFDIEARFDKVLHLPTSVKVTGTDTVTLSDARRFWSISEPFRMFVGSYIQHTAQKEFHTIHEFIVHGAMLSALFGRITQAEVAAIHTGLGSGQFPRGKHKEARAWARASIARLVDQRGLVVLNPKIDSKTQRRLQCSASLRALQGLAEQFPTYAARRTTQASYTAHRDQLGRMALPVRLVSDQREFGSSN